MRRGDIYIIKRRDTIGAEIMKARPGVIISNDALNDTSEVVEVVYLTTSPKKDLPTHVSINATGVESVVLCEQIDSVSLRLLGECVGTCTREEMAAIDNSLLCSLGLNRSPRVERSDHEKWLEEHLEACIIERDRYAKIIDLLLEEADA